MKEIYDIAIIGAGPAGLTAAIYALRDDKKVILLEENVEGGQILNSSSVVNIPGFSEISGAAFIEKMLTQINSFPEAIKLLTTEYKTVQDVVKKHNFIITTTEGDTFEAKTVICATGSSYRRLGVDGEKDLIGKGISFCSTCDAPFYRGKDVAVIGGGNSALTEALELSKFASSIRIYQNLSMFTGSADLQDRVLINPKVSYTFNTEVRHFERVGNQIKIVFNNGEIVVDGVFIAIGLAPHNEYAKNIAVLDGQGYIKSMVEGAYAAGDCKKITANQVVVACGSGAKAAIKACRYLNTGEA